jgi:hypothetical protein
MAITAMNGPTGKSPTLLSRWPERLRFPGPSLRRLSAHFASCNFCLTLTTATLEGPHLRRASTPKGRQVPGQLRDLACAPLDNYAFLSARSSPSSLPSSFGSSETAVFCGSAADLLVPDGAFFASEHKLQPSRFTELSVSIAQRRSKV